jgi:hypothetical protein
MGRADSGIDISLLATAGQQCKISTRFKSNTFIHTSLQRRLVSWIVRHRGRRPTASFSVIFPSFLVRRRSLRDHIVSLRIKDLALGRCQMKRLLMNIKHNMMGWSKMRVHTGPRFGTSISSSREIDGDAQAPLTRNAQGRDRIDC